MPVIDSRPTISLKKIMYATDFSPAANRAGSYARVLAQRFNSRVEIAHVFPSYDGANCFQKERRNDRERLAIQQSEFRAAGIDTCFLQSGECPLPAALLLMERQLAPNLIVIGTGSKSSFDRFLLGSTAEHLIRNAVGPVLTVGPHAKEPKQGPLAFERIVFAADFSDASNRAGTFALAFAEDAGAHLWIAHIANPRGADADTNDTKFQEELKRLIPPESYGWCEPQFAVEQGNPAEGILRLAERVHADLIVMGARARSFWLMHMRRGVTQDVLAQATCPVLTVH